MRSAVRSGWRSFLPSTFHISRQIKKNYESSGRFLELDREQDEFKQCVSGKQNFWLHKSFVGLAEMFHDMISLSSVPIMLSFIYDKH